VPYHARRLEQEMLEPDAVAMPHSFAVVAPGNQIIALALSAWLADASLASIYLAVDPDFRGRGLATALKQKLIAHAQEHSIAALSAENDRRNCAMRAINERLGYRKLIERLVYQQSLA
jgi:RimJ/RimL family protein N-acetyltransferase